MATPRSSAADKFNFVSEPDDALICPICLEVADDPRQHQRCGRLFCRKCLDKYGRYRPCPCCRTVKPLYFADTKSKRYIITGVDLESLWRRGLTCV